MVHRASHDQWKCSMSTHMCVQLGIACMHMLVLAMSTFVRMEEGVPECRTHKGVTVGRGTSGTGVEQVKTNYTSLLLTHYTHMHTNHFNIFLRMQYM